MDVNLLEYKALNRFTEIYYDSVMRISNYKGDHIHVKKYTRPDGAVVQDVNQSFYVLRDNTDEYLLPSEDMNGEDVSLEDVLPIKIIETSKISFNSKTYYLIKKYATVKFKSELKKDFRELVNTFSSLDSTHPRNYKIAVVSTLMSWITRVNFRLASNPGFGKDSLVMLFSYLVGNCDAVQSPNRPKLELLSSNSILSITEAVALKKNEWRTVSNYLLDAGAYKTKITKGTRSYKEVGETINMNETSILLFYNEVVDYLPDKFDEYFDNVADNQLKDRFPAFRLRGSITQTFDYLDMHKVGELVENNMDFYKDVIRSLYYYKEHFHELIDYDIINEQTKKYSIRQRTALNAILAGFYLYSESDAEFEAWCKQVKDSMQQYNSMIMFQNNVNQLDEEKMFEQYFNNNSYLKSKYKSYENMLELDRVVKPPPLQTRLLKLRDKYEDYEVMWQNIMEAFEVKEKKKYKGVGISDY